MAIVKHKYGMVSKNSQVGFILEAVQKLCIKANNLVNLKHEQEKGVNCLSEGRGFLRLCLLDMVNILYFNCDD